MSKKAEKSLEDAKSKLKIFQVKDEENRKYYHETVSFLGYAEGDNFYNENGAFFKMLISFFDDITKAMPKQEIKKVLTGKRPVGKRVDQNALMSNIMNQLKQKVNRNK